MHCDVTRFPTTTIPALALIERAYREDAALGTFASFAVRDALFEEGVDISEPTYLAHLSTQLEIPTPDNSDRLAVYASWRTGRIRGVQGSPHFFCGDTEVFCPSLSIDHQSNGSTTITSDVTRLQSFCIECYAQPQNR
jgi:2-hydroxychromene-2-carboxylate isomerase